MCGAGTDHDFAITGSANVPRWPPTKNPLRPDHQSGNVTRDLSQSFISRYGNEQPFKVSRDEQAPMYDRGVDHRVLLPAMVY
jgi:hypothetical protein